VYDLVREGRIPHRRLGRKVVFSREALADFLRGSDTTAAPIAANGEAKAPGSKRDRKGAANA
jgi:Helix-turn-helix domain